MVWTIYGVPGLRGSSTRFPESSNKWTATPESPALFSLAVPSPLVSFQTFPAMEAPLIPASRLEIWSPGLMVTVSDSPVPLTSESKLSSPP